MKRTNNKFRNNNSNSNSNSNQIYSLNYKFDSISIAGKISGTALDLIKRYNELAKEAHGNNDYVTSEIFRQYAEHYRKIVTDINEKKNSQKMAAIKREADAEASQGDNSVSNDNLGEASTLVMCNNNQSGDSDAGLSFDNVVEKVDASQVVEKAEKKEFKVIEISSAEANKISSNNAVTKPRAKRLPRKKDDIEVVAV